MYMSVVVNALSYIQFYCTASRLLISYYLALCYIFVISRDVNLALCSIKMLLSWFCLVSCGRYLRIFVSEAVFALQPRRFPMTAALKLDGNDFTIDVAYRTRHDCHDGCYYIYLSGGLNHFCCSSLVFNVEKWSNALYFYERIDLSKGWLNHQVVYVECTTILGPK